MKFGYTIMEEQKLNTETDLVKKEIKPEDYLKQREDLSVPCTVELEETCGPGCYAELTEIDTHMQEFTELVKKMKEELVNEKRVLEGTSIPTYESILKKENQQSNK